MIQSDSTLQNHTMSKEDNRINPYPIRLTKELTVKLEDSAKLHGRSLNAEMLLRLEASFSDESQNNAHTLTVEQVKELIREELARLTKAGIKLAD